MVALTIFLHLKNLKNPKSYMHVFSRTIDKVDNHNKHVVTNAHPRS